MFTALRFFSFRQNDIPELVNIHILYIYIYVRSLTKVRDILFFPFKFMISASRKSS